MSGRKLEGLRREQTLLSKRLILDDDFSDIDRVCGIDVSYSGSLGCCALALFDYETLELLEVRTRKARVTFPYIPTFLAYREFEAMTPLAKTLDRNSDVLLVDGSGILHPRRMGLASHLGMKLDRVTVGVAKSLPCGELRGMPGRKGVRADVIFDGEVLGAALSSPGSRKPIYVSQGHRISLETSVHIVARCSKTRIPEPLRAAHLGATKALL